MTNVRLTNGSTLLARQQDSDDHGTHCSGNRNITVVSNLTWRYVNDIPLDANTDLDKILSGDCSGQSV